MSDPTTPVVSSHELNMAEVSNLVADTMTNLQQAQQILSTAGVTPTIQTPSPLREYLIENIAQVETLNAKLTELGNTNAALLKKSMALDISNAQLTASLTKAQASVADLTKQLASANGRVTNLQGRLTLARNGLYSAAAALPDSPVQPGTNLVKIKASAIYAAKAAVKASG